MVELRRIELLTSCVQGRRSPSWATAPFLLRLFPLLFVARALSLSHILMYAPSFVCTCASISAKILAKTSLEVAWFALQIFACSLCFCFLFFEKKLFCALIWWVWVDLNHRPHPYQGCALTKLSYRPAFLAAIFFHALRYDYSLAQSCTDVHFFAIS